MFQDVPPSVVPHAVADPGSAPPVPVRRAGMAWQWGKTGQTQQALLEAAREVFTGQGFAGANVAEIAARAGMTPGVIYHHFGGKNELYVALWRRHSLAHGEAARRAVARARQEGVTGGAELWAVGTRAVLRGTWVRKDLATLFFAGNGPPGFEAMRRDRRAHWDRAADALPQVTGPVPGGLPAAILSAVVSEGARAVAAAGSREDADAIIEEVIEYAGRLITNARPDGGHPRRNQAATTAGTANPAANHHR
jgi:AcrR family transcriptional regulator